MGQYLDRRRVELPDRAPIGKPTGHDCGDHGQHAGTAAPRTRRLARRGRGGPGSGTLVAAAHADDVEDVVAGVVHVILPGGAAGADKPRPVRAAGLGPTDYG